MTPDSPEGKLIAFARAQEAADLCKDDRVMAIKGILIREGGEISESNLNFELMQYDLSYQDLEIQLERLETYGYIDRAPDTVKLGKAWTGDQVE